MPKKKTKKAAAKRFRITASGLVKYKRCGGGHLLSSKSRKRKRRLRNKNVFRRSISKRIVALFA
jgi:large subunit ribosomal protein L35